MLFTTWNTLVRAVGLMGFSFPPRGRFSLAVCVGMWVSYLFPLKSCARELLVLSSTQLQLIHQRVLQWEHHCMARHSMAQLALPWRPAQAAWLQPLLVLLALSFWSKLGTSLCKAPAPSFLPGL